MARKDNLTAYHLIDDETHGYGHHEESPWDTDHRGAGVFYERATRVRPVKSVNTKFPTFRKRNLTEETKGVLTYECTYQIVSGDGFYLGFWGDKGDEKEAFVLRQKNGAMYAGEKLMYKVDNNWHFLQIKIDIDNGCVKLSLDGKYINTAPFTGKAKTISRLMYGYEVADMGETLVHMNMKLYKNYLFLDQSPAPDACGFIPEEYTIEKNGKATVVRRPYHSASKNIVYEVKGCTGSTTTITRGFARTGGVVGFEVKYLLPKAGGKLTVSLLNGSDEAISLYDDLTELRSKDGVLKAHCKNVWQTLRIEADTNNQTALIRLNGKIVTTIALDNACDYIDGVKFAFVCDKAATLMLFEPKAFPVPPLPDDYVPAPILPKKKGDYYIGMNICSLWREGSMYGWDCISSFKENKPLLGYYDEGIIETADWELKWMAEHGLDFQLYCWYQNDTTMPIVNTWLSNEIHNGHMLAKYSDTVKIALLWEAASSRRPSNFEEFRDYTLPYFIDYFFSDPRYMHIHGTAIMSIYGPEVLAASMGGAEVTKKCFDYMRKEVKKLGYKDLVILCCGNSKPLYKECGIDGCHCYNWDKKGYDIDFTKAAILANVKEGSVHAVPCVSMGYNDVAWAGKRYPVLKPEDMVTLLEWCKEELLDKQDKNSWKSKLLILSTWNEYGEGTYMMPAGVHGFGYLDALRKVFYEDIPHVDVIPNQDQLDRVCLLYPQDRSVLAPLHTHDDDDIDLPVLKKYEFKTKKDLEKWEINNLTSYEIKDGMLWGHSEGKDPHMYLHDDSFFPISTEKIGKIVVNIRTNKPGMAACCIQQSFLRANEQWSGQATILTEPKAVTPLTLYPAKIKGYWHDVISGYRLDPVWMEGDFELESVVFYEAEPHKVLYLNGEILDMAQVPYEEDGVNYLPFDTKSKLKFLPNMYYEWNPTLETFTIFSEKTVMFTVDSDVAVLDGKEVQLKKSFVLYDGIPHIPFDIFCDVTGMKLEITETDIRISY